MYALDFIISSLAALVAGILGALGLGGGGALLLWLTLGAGIEQTRAQGINLLFFLPCALGALIFHLRSKLVRLKPALTVGAIGLCGAIVGCLLSSYLGGEWLRRIFGIYMLLLGVRELFIPAKKEN